MTLSVRQTMEYEGKKVLVVGMARSGAAAVKLLSRLGAEVYVYDIKKFTDLPDNVKAVLNEISYIDILGRDPLDYIDELDMLVLSPGVPLGLPFIKAAYEKNKRVIAEIELGYSVSEADFIAITGTNGKTTTVSLTGEIFKNSGLNTYVLGNVGTPVTQEALNTKKGDVVVAETAALQLDTIDNYKPKGSAILNITEDHLDRYGTMENYIAAKAKIFKNQTMEDYCVLNYDNEIVRDLAKVIKARVVWFSAYHKLDAGAYVEDGDIIFSYNGSKTSILKADEVRIPGKHNLQNALAATALACLYNIAPKTIANTLKTFKGVEHRIEFVREVDGVTFINDSKGTNPDATINAVKAMKKPTVLILGGYDKKSDFRPLFKAFTKEIRTLILLGATAGKIAETADEVGFDRYICASDFEDAIFKAYSMAEPGGTVLLSPACASWDMFKDFEQRGQKFKEIVKGL